MTTNNQQHRPNTSGMPPRRSYDRYTVRIALFSLALACITAALIVFAPRQEDVRVLAQQPNGDRVAVDSQISITFSRPVDQRSAERAFLLFPPVPGRFIWQGDQTLIFVPRDRLPAQTRYRVVVRTGLRDSHGRLNRTETGWLFRTL